MRLAIMQPYFLPYIGYLQLMSAVDKFVLLDDVNFINRGWINRNRISIQGEPVWLTIPLVKASQNKLINALQIVPDESWKRKLLRTVESTYARAPFAPQGLALFSGILQQAEGSLSSFLFRTLQQVADYLGVTTTIEPTSAVYPKAGLLGQSRILDICMREQTSAYLNLPGGRSLYDEAAFTAAGVELLFLDANLPEISLQSSTSDGLMYSILDVIMHNSPEAIHEALGAARWERNSTSSAAGYVS